MKAEYQITELRKSQKRRRKVREPDETLAVESSAIERAEGQIEEIRHKPMLAMNLGKIAKRRLDRMKEM